MNYDDEYHPILATADSTSDPVDEIQPVIASTISEHKTGEHLASTSATRSNEFVDEITPVYQHEDLSNKRFFQFDSQDEKEDESNDSCFEVDNKEDDKSDSSDYDESDDHGDEEIKVTLRSIAHNDQNMSINEDVANENKRSYRYIKRNKGRRDISNKRARWNANIKSEEDLKTLDCCRKECFHNLNSTALFQNIGYALSATNSERRSMLASMLTSDGTFFYDGKPVCSTFLLKAFNYSRDLQSSVKKVPNRYIDKSISNRKAHMKYSIIDIINRLAELTAEKMPDKDQVHLPFSRKNDVFQHVISEFKDLYGSSASPPSTGYISSVWKTHCRHVKVRKKCRFTVCSICEEIRVSFENALKSKADTSTILSRKRAHLDFIENERLEYRRKRNNSIRNPSKYCSLIIDGADQSAYGLPHFTTTTKDVVGLAMKVRLIGVLQHASTNTLRLFTMTEEHKTGSNHIVEALHRSLNDMAMTESLPSSLFLQADNCFRENKNRYLFGFAEALVAWKLFDEVEVAFLPKGHTHEDIDQSFSTTSKALNHTAAITLQDIHQVLRGVFNSKTQVSHMKFLANWSELCEMSGCLRSINNFTNYQYFKFVGRQVSDSNTGNKSRVSNRLANRQVSKYRETSCFVKHIASGDWKNLIDHGPSMGHGFLKFPPDLSSTPPLNITEISGIEEVNKRFNSEEQRINSTAKMRQLIELRDYVYRARTEKFHWNLKTCVELSNMRLDVGNVVSNGNSKGKDIAVKTKRERVATLRDKVVNDFEYNTGDLVATLIANDINEGCPFWIAKVLKIIRNRDGIVSNLEVQWLELNKSNDVFSGKYKMATRTNRQKRSIPWIDMISSDSVLVTFSSLTRAENLPMSVQKHLRSITNNPDLK